MSSKFSKFTRTTILQSYSLQLALFFFTTSWVLVVGPESLGISSVFYAIIALPIGVIDAGLIASIVTRDSLSCNELRAISAQQTLLGFVLGLVIVTYALFGHRNDGVESLRSLLVLMGFAMPIISLSRLRLVVFYRNLRAGRLAYIRWVGVLSRYLIAWGVWLFFSSLLSLAIGVAASVLLENLLVIVLWPKEEQVGFVLPHKKEISELSNRLLGAGEQLLTELRRQLDVLVLSIFISSEFLGAYVYLSRLLLQARDTIMIPIYSIMLAAYSKLRGRNLFIKKIFLEQQRLLANTLLPGLLFFGAFLQYFGGSLITKIQVIVEYSVLVSIISASSILTYMSVALMYGYRQFNLMISYGAIFLIALSFAYFSISFVSFKIMLAIVAIVWLFGVVLQYFYQLRRIRIVGFIPYIEPVIFPIFITFFVLIVNLLFEPNDSAIITAFISIIWLFFGIYAFKIQLTLIMDKVLANKRHKVTDHC